MHPPVRWKPWAKYPKYNLASRRGVERPLDTNVIKVYGIVYLGKTKNSFFVNAGPKCSHLNVISREYLF